MNRIGDLFRKRRSIGCTDREADELFRLLHIALEPFVRRQTRDTNDGRHAPWDRIPSGLHDSMEVYWQQFVVEKLLDESWPEGKEIAPNGEVGYIVVSFRHYLDGLRAQIKTAKLASTRSPREDGTGPVLHFPMSRDGRNISAIRDGVVDFTKVFQAPLPGESAVDIGGRASTSSQEEIRASDPDFQDAVHWDKDPSDAALGDTEESAELARRYSDAANKWLSMSDPWVPALLLYLLAPQVLDGEPPLPRTAVAQIARVSVAAITARAGRLGLPTLNKDGAPRLRKEPHGQQTLLTEWLTTHCGITELSDAQHRAWLALRQLCICARSHVRSTQS